MSNHPAVLRCKLFYSGDLTLHYVVVKSHQHIIKCLEQLHFGKFFVIAQKISIQQLLGPLVTILPTATIHQSLVQDGCYGKLESKTVKK